MSWSSLYEFTEYGLAMFRRVFTGQLSEEAINLSDPAVATRIDGTGSFTVVPLGTARELALRCCRGGTAPDR